MKKLLLLLLFPIMGFSQQSITTLIGYKSFELNFKTKGNLNFGVATSITDSKEIADRATKMDPKPFTVHTANTKVSPSLFLLIGATIDDFTVTGKLGATYFNQNINNVKENQNIYRSVGAQIQYKNFVFSYDSTNSAMIGYEFNFN
jgi:hypothetical protein